MVNLTWDWNSTQEAAEGGSRLDPGGYVCMIVRVENVPEKEYLKVFFDVAEGVHKSHFRQPQQAPQQAQATPFVSYSNGAADDFATDDGDLPF